MVLATLFLSNGASRWHCAGQSQNAISATVSELILASSESTSEVKAASSARWVTCAWKAYGREYDA